MDNPEYEHKNRKTDPVVFLTGLLLGGLAGAGAMLLLAPQSGERTRASIQQKSMELRDQTAEAVDDAVTHARVKARQIAAGAREKAKDVQQRGQAMLGDRKRLHISDEIDKMVNEGSPA